MRFVATTLQYFSLVLGFWSLFFVLPWWAFGLLLGVAYLFFSVYISAWIVELAGDFFFQSRIDPKNKAVLITGCDSGFGHELAKVLDKGGYHVFACCLDSLGEGAMDLKEVCTSRVKVIQMDITKDDSVLKALKIVQESLGKAELWSVVNNAGILKGFQTDLCSMSDFEDCLQVNTLGMIRVTKAFLPLLRKSKGRVVNICSLSGRFRVQQLGPYSLSKTAAVAFSDLLRQELREFGMRVVSVEPEFFKALLQTVLQEGTSSDFKFNQAREHTFYGPSKHNYLHAEGTPMSSDVHTRGVLKHLDHLEEPLRKAYGSKYIEQSKKFVNFIFSRSCPDTGRVMRAVESAVSLQNPADVYRPARSAPFRFLFFLGDRLHQSSMDLFLMFVSFAAGVPAPKGGINVFARVFKM